METPHDKKFEIVCIGNEKLRHVCNPWNRRTKCGVKVVKKEVTKQDIRNHFGCYECTY